MPQKAINSIVIHPPENGGIQFEHLDEPIGKPWLYKGQYVSLVYEDGAKDKEGDYLPYEPAEKVHLQPGELFDALDWRPAKRIFSYKNTLMDKINAWTGVAAIAIAGLIIIMLLDVLMKP